MVDERGGPRTAGRPFSFARPGVLCLAVAIGTLLRTAPVVDRPLSLDEALTWRTAGQPWGDFLAWSHHPDHPPLSFAAVRAATDLAGTDAEWALRLPAVVAGAFAIPAAAAVGGALSPAAGLAFAALVAVDPVLVEQSRVARMYSLLVLFLLLTVALAARVAGSGDRRRGAWIALGLVLGAAIWTHALGAAAWLAVLAAVPFAARPARRRLAGALAVAGALALPGLIALLGGGFGGRGRPGSLADAAGQWRPVAEGILGLFELGVPDWLLVACGVAGLAVFARRAPVPAFLLGAIAALTILAALLAAPARPFGIDRYLVPVHLAVLAGLGALAALPVRGGWRNALIAGTALVVLAFAWRALPRGVPADHRAGAVARSLARIAEGSPAVFRPAYLRHVGAYYGVEAAVEEPEEGPVWIVTQDQRLLAAGGVGALPGEVRRRLPAVAAERGAALDLDGLDRLLGREGALGIRVGDGQVQVLTPGGPIPWARANIPP